MKIDAFLMCEQVFYISVDFVYMFQMTNTKYVRMKWQFFPKLNMNTFNTVCSRLEYIFSLDRFWIFDAFTHILCKNDVHPICDIIIIINRWHWRRSVSISFISAYLFFWNAERFDICFCFWWYIVVDWWKLLMPFVNGSPKNCDDVNFACF